MQKKAGAHNLNAERKFILYEYLTFFWKKKIYFLIIPLLTAALSAMLFILWQDTGSKYIGKAEVFTGSIKAQSLTNPANLKERFADSGVEVYVSEKSHVRFSLEGNDKEKLRTKLETTTQEYEKDLMNNYKERLAISEEYVKVLDERSTALKSVLKVYKEDLENNDYPIDQFDDLAQLIAETEGELTKSLERLNRIKGDLVFFEKPEVLSIEVKEKESHWKKGAALGLLLGLILTLGLLVLLKYIGEARRYAKHD